MSFALSKQFKRDLSKLAPEILASYEWAEVMYHLHRRRPLPERYLDHALGGEWRGYRDCHVKNDLVLIYRHSGEDLLLARLNSHSEVFG